MNLTPKQKFLASAFLAAVFLFLYYTNTNFPSLKSSLFKNEKLQALITNAGSDGIDIRTATSDCKIDGSYSDHACTPGAIFENVTADDICTSGYTKTVRSVSTKLKGEVYAEYGIAYPQERGTYEADHLIPLELGGNNDIANLFPESADPKPGFHEKDLVENYLNHAVCAGVINLKDAQVQIADDWLSVYNTLTPDQLSELKQEYQSWAVN